MKKEKNSQSEEQLGLFPSIFVIPEKGKDEMNLAEFPIAAIGHRIPKGVCEITFEDEIIDKGTNQIISRSVTIKAPPSEGLPTPLDDEIILAFVNLWKQQGGTSKNVFFTRHQIIQILGWTNHSHYYDRIKESVERWVAVSLHYKNAWWNKENLQWQDGAINLIDSVIWAEKSGEVSEMIWGHKIFESLKSGNIRSLDLKKFRDIKSSSARRMFRFLDKRFHFSNYFKDDLKKFAYNKIGFSKKADIYKIKKQMLPAIKQLEAIGFIKPLSPAHRFTKTGKGLWEIHFQKAAKKSTSGIGETEEVGVVCDLSQTILDLGVSPGQVKKIIEDHPKELMEEWLEVIKFLASHKTKETPKNPAGYLVKALKEKWPFPPDYRTIEQRKIAAQEEKAKLTKLEGLKSAKKQKALTETERIAAENQLAAEQQRKVDEYMVILSPLERSKIKKVAFNAAKDQPFIEVKGTAGDIARETAIVDYVLKILED